MSESRANRTRTANGEWEYLDQDDAEFVLMSWPEHSIEAVDDFVDSGKLPEETILMLRGIRHEGLQASIAKNIPLMEAHLSRLYFACRAAGMLDAARAGIKHSKSQAKKAKQLRAAKTDDGESLHQLIARLATANEYQDEKAKQLWTRFYGELDRAGLCPEANETSNDERKWSIEYDYNNSRKSMTLGRFSTLVSDSRNKKSR